MPLKFDGSWRFSPPADGEYFLQTVPDDMVEQLMQALSTCTTQGFSKALYEHFKKHFCKVTVSYYGSSTSEDWAKHDLESKMKEANRNAPLFIEAFINATQSWQESHSGYYLPPISQINQTLSESNVGYIVHDDELILRNEVVLIEQMQPPEEIGDKAIAIYNESMVRSEALLQEGRGREAVQELLWLLETISTAFRGAKTETGSVEGAYFNRIVAELKENRKDTTFSQILKWISTMHGYLSSPAGGGVRHGLDLDKGVELKGHEAELFCNLIRSYVNFLLRQYETIGGRAE